MHWEASLGECKRDLHCTEMGHGTHGHWVTVPHLLELLLCCSITICSNHSILLAALAGAEGAPEHMLYTTDAQIYSGVELHQLQRRLRKRPFNLRLP